MLFGAWLWFSRQYKIRAVGTGYRKAFWKWFQLNPSPFAYVEFYFDLWSTLIQSSSRHNAVQLTKKPLVDRFIRRNMFIPYLMCRPRYKILPYRRGLWLVPVNVGSRRPRNLGLEGLVVLVEISEVWFVSSLPDRWCFLAQRNGLGCWFIAQVAWKLSVFLEGKAMLFYFRSRHDVGSAVQVNTFCLVYECFGLYILRVEHYVFRV
jgi:hypothetical protein